MKKVRLILAAAACCAAGIGVFANNTVAPAYFISNSSGTASCVTSYTGTVCAIGTSTQCTVILPGDVTRWVSRIDDTPGATCQMHFRN